MPTALLYTGGNFLKLLVETGVPVNKPLACHKSLTNYYKMLYTLSRTAIKFSNAEVVMKP